MTKPPIGEPSSRPRRKNASPPSTRGEGGSSLWPLPGRMRDGNGPLGAMLFRAPLPPLPTNNHTPSSFAPQRDVLRDGKGFSLPARLSSVARPLEAPAASPRSDPILTRDTSHRATHRARGRGRERERESLLQGRPFFRKRLLLPRLGDVRVRATLEAERTLHLAGHTAAVWAQVSVEGWLISGSGDRAIRRGTRLHFRRWCRRRCVGGGTAHPRGRDHDRPAVTAIGPP